MVRVEENRFAVLGESVGQGRVHVTDEHFGSRPGSWGVGIRVCATLTDSCFGERLGRDEALVAPCLIEYQ